jgi:hypothetical protein
LVLDGAGIDHPHDRAARAGHWLAECARCAPAAADGTLDVQAWGLFQHAPT